MLLLERVLTCYIVSLFYIYYLVKLVFSLWCSRKKENKEKEKRGGGGGGGGRNGWEGGRG